MRNQIPSLEKKGKDKENKGWAWEDFGVHIHREVEARLREDAGHLWPSRSTGPNPSSPVTVGFG